MENHFILCGLGRVGWRVLEYLQATGAPVVVIDSRCAADDPRLGTAGLIAGDCRLQEHLEKAEVARARGVLIVTSDDLVNISTALMVRHLHHGVRIVVRMFNQGLITRLGKAVDNVFALSTSALAAPLLALIARTGEALGTFVLEDGHRYQVAELNVPRDSELAGTTLADLAARHDVQVLGHVSGGTRVFFHNVDSAARLRPGDRVIICGEPKQLGPLLAKEEEVSLPDLLWAGTIRRFGRMLWRTIRAIDLPVKICTVVLLAVIFVSVLVFHFGMEKDTLVDAFYRAISLIATGADMGGRDLPEGGWQRVYVSALRLIGTALVASFTAIFTNYLVRANLGGALEVRRIPESGHVIVCGLGNVGFRVVGDLVQQGERVVAIERQRDNPFIPTARRLGVAVIVGDAIVPEVLRQAHAATAKAVVAATSNELVNIEVALLVRELNPKMRVVLRLIDPRLARTMREAASVRLALSIPDLAAPAFVAALFGDRVLSMFLVEGRLMAVVDLVVQAQDGVLENQSIRALAVDYQMAPISVLDAQGQPKPLRGKLDAGDRLTAILALPDLQRLLQRDKAPRDCAVEVSACPDSARAALAQLLQHGATQDGATRDETRDDAIDRVVEQFPISLGTNLTRGQAEELLELLRRDQIVGHLRRAEEERS